jgi:flagellar protein FlaI
MTEHGSKRISDDLRRTAAKHPHLRDHLRKFKQIAGEFPMLIDELTGEYEVPNPNVIYHVGGPVYCHVYGDFGRDTKYYAVEPELGEGQKDMFERVRRRLLDISVSQPSPEEESDYDDRIEELLGEILTREDESGIGAKMTEYAPWIEPLVESVSGEIVDDHTYETVRYRLNRDIVGLGPLEPVMRDDTNEDIHVIGPERCYVDNEVFGMLNTNIEFSSPGEYDTWLRNMGERIGDPVSDSDPIVDSTLPDGSRINIIYSDDVSLDGPSLTIRQDEGVPLSILQITKWGTLSPELAAYLWLCLENEQTVFVVGETASGKTTTLNSMLSFVPRDHKIYTAEDTSEVMPPHDNWQQLLTREGSGEGSSDVDMFDLVAAALRSRPDYIVVGEVRGEEGRMAFQAAQTGHPVMLTFHASDIVSMIQRFTGDPINVPETFMDNCDVALFQNRVKREDEILRRVTSVQEIEGYSEEMGGVVTRQSFYWDPAQDEIVFQGVNNSYVLEEQIATLLGYEDTRKIYDDLQHRARVIERAIEEDILGYHEVNETIEAYQRDGIEGIPFEV